MKKSLFSKKFTPTIKNDLVNHNDIFLSPKSHIQKDANLDTEILTQLIKNRL
jgi:hypothetical protein